MVKKIRILPLLALFFINLSHTASAQVYYAPGEIYDCSGTLNGSVTFDQCGVCGGDGKSCIDCNGEPFGKNTYDVCGVCGGDGSSCACVENNIYESLLKIDVKARGQSALAIRAAARLSIVAGSSNEISAFSDKIKKEANRIYFESRQDVWSVPQIIKSCPVTNPSACITKSNSEILKRYTLKAKSLYDLNRRVLKQVRSRKMQEGFKNAAQYERKAREGYEGAIEALGAIPALYIECK